MNKKNLFWGMILILLAVYVLVSKMGWIPELPIGKLLVTALCVYLVIKGIIRRSFPQILIPVAVIGCQYDEFLGITAITPWTLLAVTILLSIGLGLIFPEKRHQGFTEVHYRTINDNGTSENSSMNDRQPESNCTQDTTGDIVHYENNFNGTNQYVSSQKLLRAKIENNFGQCNVYFNNARLLNGKATIVAENNFGQTNLYIPQNWRVQLEQKAAFGDIKMHGTGNSDMDAPYILIQASCNMGEINIYFD